MLLSKANLYPEQDQLTSFFAGSFTHPARLRIMRTLKREGPLIVNDIASDHPLSLSGVSQHLEILRHKEVVEFNKLHPYLIYEINNAKYVEARDYILRFFDEIG